MSAIKDSWSDRQREIIVDMLEHQDGQVNVAQRMGIRQPTVQRMLAKGKYYTYKDAIAYFFAVNVVKLNMLSFISGFAKIAEISQVNCEI